MTEQKVTWIQSFMDCHASLYEVEGEMVRVNCPLGCGCCEAIVGIDMADMRVVRLEVETDQEFGCLGEFTMHAVQPIFESASSAITAWRKR